MRLPHQPLQFPAFLDGFARIQAVLQRAFLLPRGAPDPGAPPCIRQRATSILIDENGGRGPFMRLANRDL
jgi:hypothetical protein